MESVEMFCRGAGGRGDRVHDSAEQRQTDRLAVLVDVVKLQVAVFRDL
jgi:hypothetical protein